SRATRKTARGSDEAIVSRHHASAVAWVSVARKDAAAPDATASMSTSARPRMSASPAALPSRSILAGTLRLLPAPAPPALMDDPFLYHSRMDILDAIGETTLVELRRVVPEECGAIFVKCEWENPTGSMKDRMARAVIDRAAADGRLRPGDGVVEYTGGSTGASLALVCAARGHHIRILTSDAFSREKRDQMAALGAELVIIPSEGGRTTKALIEAMIEKARTLSREPNTYWTDQLRNQDSLAGYHPLGEEIWRQTDGMVDAFVHS